jgi:hypothetical protein
MTFTFIVERCSDLPVATCCRVMGVSTWAFLRVAGGADLGSGLGRRGLDQHHRRHPPHEPALLWQPPRPRRAPLGPGPSLFPQTGGAAMREVSARGCLVARLDLKRAMGTEDWCGHDPVQRR